MAGNEGNEKLTRARMRASHTDRDQAINRLKAAFVEGRLTTDELVTRAAQAFSARTYADLAALTADLPAEPAAVPGQPVPARRRRPVHPRIKVGAAVIALIVTVFMMLVVLTGASVMPVVAAAVIAVVFGVPAAIVVSVPIVVVLKLEARRRNRSGGQLPPRQSPGTPGQAPRPAIEPPPIDRDQPAAEAVRPVADRAVPADDPAGRGRNGPGLSRRGPRTTPSEGAAAWSGRIRAQGRKRRAGVHQILPEARILPGNFEAGRATGTIGR